MGLIKTKHRKARGGRPDIDRYVARLLRYVRRERAMRRKLEAYAATPRAAEWSPESNSRTTQAQLDAFDDAVKRASE